MSGWAPVVGGLSGDAGEPAWATSSLIELGSYAPATVVEVGDLDKAALLELYDRRLRREAKAPEIDDSRLEHHAKTVVWYGAAADDWSGVVWSDLGEEDADEVIAEEIGRLRQWGRPFEWKYFSHDRPADLPRRLEAAGLRPEAEESVMVADLEELDLRVAAPDGIVVRRVADRDDVAALLDVHEEVFGSRDPWIGRMIERSLGVGRPAVVGVVAWAGVQPVCEARVDFHEGTEFASFWGGATLPEWRGRGIYRAVVAYRAALARHYGYRYAQVDALPTSRPILERLGFVRLTTTTPYVPDQD